MQLDYLIIGAQRSGTTSLMHYIGKHPRVHFRAAREVCYFCHNYGRGLAWYERKLGRRRPGKLRGEKSPDYMLYREVPRRVARVAPGVKLIVALRDPVERAHSSYKLGVLRQGETRSIEDAIWGAPTRESTEFAGLTISHYLAFGHYAEQLERWFHFFPREQFFIMHSANLFRRPARQCRRLLAFLGLPPYSHRFRKEGVLVRGKPLPETTRRKLIEYYRPHNQHLYELLNFDFGWPR